MTGVDAALSEQHVILLVEDNPSDEELTLRALKKSNIAQPGRRRARRRGGARLPLRAEGPTPGATPRSCRRSSSWT